jgi:hypothetical protein
MRVVSQSDHAMSDFAWTFPCYVLAKISEHGVAFASPDNRIGVFTDIDLAERFKHSQHQDDASFVIMPILSAPILCAFLQFVSGDYRGVAVDPDHQKMLAFGFPQALRSLLSQDQ